jgi:hypothetical protein
MKLRLYNLREFFAEQTHQGAAAQDSSGRADHREDVAAEASRISTSTPVGSV